MASLLPKLTGGNLLVLETVFYMSKPLLVRADIVTVAVEYTLVKFGHKTSHNFKAIFKVSPIAL